MPELSGKTKLSALRKKWVYKALLSQFFRVFAFTLFLFALLHKLFFFPFYWAIPCLVILFLLATLIKPRWKLSERDVSGYLNVTQPSLEESTQLILRPESSLNLLEKLQVKKVENRLLSLHIPPPFKKQFNTSLMVLLLALSAAAGLFIIPFNPAFSTPETNAKKITVLNPRREIVLPQIKNAVIIITPPSYTGKGSKKQSAFNVIAEEGAVVAWQIQTNIAAKEVKFIFNDGKIVSLSADVDRSNWKAQIIITTSGFYQLKINNTLSEFYKIELFKDLPPAITIQSPKPNTFITYGLPEKVITNVILTDDYGINSASIIATVSSGQGEAVKFKEQKLLFNNFTAGSKTWHLQKLIDCKALGMTPGDELYFFVSASDNHNQQTRSDVYIITLQDTTDLMSMEGMALNLEIKTELFRSERQIIIETEQLLRDRANINVAEFKKKSNDLGIDQNLLRLRYGKFLGEEAHTETGEEDDHNEQQSNNNNNTDILKKYGHEHDNAEDATFFDASTKKQLKGMLNEMWNAELKLRTFLPKDALPYEYRALLLLKDLQQKSRVYVQKTGIKVTPLKADKRLSGDLSKINQPVTRENLLKPDSAASIASKALGILEQLKNNSSPDLLSTNVLSQAFQQLSTRATNQPAVYLASLSALKKIINQNYKAKDINTAEHGLQKMAIAAEKLPYTNSNAVMNLSKQYFIHLNKGSKQ